MRQSSQHNSARLLLTLLMTFSVFTLIAGLLQLVNETADHDDITRQVIRRIVPRAFAAEEQYQATLLEQSHHVINIRPGEGITFTLRYLNSGTRDWPGHAGGFLYLQTPTDPSALKHPFWKDAHTPVTLTDSVSYQESVSVSFALHAPDAVGLYTEKFMLVDDRGSVIPGSLAEVTVNVTLNPNAPYIAPQPTSVSVSTTASGPTQQPSNPESPTNTGLTEETNTESSDPAPASSVSSTAPQVAGAATIEPLALLAQEPDIRVGIDHPDNQQVTLTADGLFGLFDSYHTLQGTYGAETMVTVTYLHGVYNVTLPSGTTVSFSGYITFEPLTDYTILEITSLDRSLAWNSSLNDNRFQGDIEIKYNPATDRLWIINILPLEDYVAGIDEVSNVDVPELNKSLAVVARTYALYHLMDNSKYSGFFHVDDEFDQVYRGYNSRIRHPLFAAEVKNTSGQVITYNNDVAVTPYFTQSDGRTRSYAEVWGTHFSAPYLVSVLVPQDAGRTLLGHGVGMSAQGAQRMAYLDGDDYLTILYHFYTGVAINKVY